MPAEEAVETPSKTRLTFIFAGGEMTSEVGDLSPDLVIAADSGYDHARRIGVPVDVLVGDLDSVTTEDLDHAESSGVSVQRHPEDKDESDLELALGAAIDAGSTEIHIFGGEAGSVGHRFSGMMLLADDQWAGRVVRWHLADAVVEVAGPAHRVAFTGSHGSQVSIIPIEDAVVTTTGLRWTLTGDLLPRGTSRGLHNELVESQATVTVEEGLAFVVKEGNQ